jgi:hypothetical protein
MNDERDASPYPYSDDMLEGDIKTYDRFVNIYKREILRCRVLGGLMVAGAVAEGSGAGWLINNDISNGRFDNFRISFGATAFLTLSVGAVWKFFEAHMINDDSQGTRDVLTKLHNGQDAGVYHGGGVD